MHVLQVISWVVCVVLTILLLWVGVGVFLSDPYFQWTTVRSPFQTTVNDDGSIELLESNESDRPIFTLNPLAQLSAFARAGARIVIYRYLPERSLGTTTAEVIQNIHNLRFDPAKPYVITGAHYSDLYVRNLGVFFNELTNDRLENTASTSSPLAKDLQNRQRIALQTLALDLAFLESTHRLVTTIVPLGGNTFTGINIYEEPSDSLHAVLFTLQKLDQSTATHQAAVQLKAKHRTALEHEVVRYLSSVMDPTTFTVKKTIRLSSARDGVKREAAFYDTVIAWKTVQLATKQDLMDAKQLPTELAELNRPQLWKQRIIEQYWRSDHGFFANDLSDQGNVFSGDSLIAFSTGLLDAKNAEDLKKMERIAQYIHDHQADQPFPLQYSATNSQNQLQPAVKLFAPGYMGEGIWSHWGIEYLKLLLALGDSALPDHCQYLSRAQAGLQTYSDNIARFGGYPELYGSDGKPFETAAVRAVMHTGWVVNYEAAQTELVRHLRTTSCQF